MNDSPQENAQSHDEDPRSVSRGWKLHTGFLGIDSLYLVVEYPHVDVYNLWSTAAPDPSDPRLYTGLPFYDFLIRKGAHGYKLSVWDGDTRLYITDYVDEKLRQNGSDKPGMGMMLQLGTKWLRRYGDIVRHEMLIKNVYAQLQVFGVRHPEQYPIRLNRLDIALDVVGLDVGAMSIDEWRDQWVGYAQQKTFHDDKHIGKKLQGLSIGSSTGGVRFKVYDKVIEAIKSRSLLFWSSVWGIDPADLPPVARFEWSIKAYEAKFTHLRYLPDLTFLGFLDLLNYVSLNWGCLRIPDPANKNKSRWQFSPLWAEIRRLIEDWSLNYDGVAKRDYHFKPDLNPAYLRSVAGWIAGLMARVGIEEGLEGHGSLSDALDALSDVSLLDKAQEKWEVYSRLLNKKGDE